MGASFSLPVTEKTIPVMETSLMVYKKWLMLASSEDINISLPENKSLVTTQFFYQEAIKHISIVFEKRLVPSNLCPPIVRNLH